jgi:hypothetical protein
VVAVALNVLLYFGYFLPRMTPLIAYINPIGISLPEHPIIETPLEPKPPQSSAADSPPPELPPLPPPPQQQYQ